MGVRKGLCLLFVVTLCSLIVHRISIACPVPDGLSGWHYAGDVTADGDLKILGDDAASWSYLYKFIYEDRGPYRISFDFRNELSPVPYVPDSDTGDFAFLDSFYATLYFVNSCPRFNLETCSYDYVLPLFDLDYNGPSNNHGEIGPSDLGPDWLHFEMSFFNYFHKLIPTFELFDENLIDDDSNVTIANVSISQVPVPASVFLLGTGLLGMILTRTRKKNPSLE